MNSILSKEHITEMKKRIEDVLAQQLSFGKRFTYRAAINQHIDEFVTQNMSDPETLKASILGTIEEIQIEHVRKKFLSLHTTQIIDQYFPQQAPSSKREEPFIQDLTRETLSQDDIHFELPPQSPLQLLFEYEKAFCQLLHEYQDEVKFAFNCQQELRKERSQLFTLLLRQLSMQFKQSNIKKPEATEWVHAFVNSYTDSLQMSGNFVETQVVKLLWEVRKRTEEEVSRNSGFSFK